MPHQVILTAILYILVNIVVLFINFEYSYMNCYRYQSFNLKKLLMPVLFVFLFLKHVLLHIF